MKGLRRNKSSTGVTKAGIKKKILLPFDNRNFHDYTQNMRRLGSYFFLFFHIFFSAFTDHDLSKT